MMATRRAVGCLAFATILSGCSHAVMFGGASGAAYQDANGAFPEPNKVAFMLEAIPLSMKASCDGHHYKFENMRVHFEQMARSTLRGSGLLLEFFGDRPPPDDADWIVTPKLELRLQGMLIHDCTAIYTVIVKDASGAVLAENKLAKGSTFGTMDMGGTACSVAMSEAAEVIPQALLAAANNGGKQ